MSDTDPNDKTEEATPERRRKAREEGQFPRAKDTGAVAATLAVLLGMAALGHELFGTLGEFAAHCFREPFALIGGEMRAIVHQALTTLVLLTAPVAVVAALAATAAGFAEAGFHPKLELAAPKWSRLEPLGKLKQLFSPGAGLANTALSLARVLVVGTVAYSVTSDALPDLARLTRAPLAAAVGELGGVALRVAAWSTLALAALAGVDYAQSWFRHEKQIRMSRQELKDELHQQEGDPRVRARQRAKARELAKRGIAKQVKESDVVITNPTHVAVALRYRPAEGAPVVAAKGYNEVAQHIKKLAKDYGIVVVENKPLARALAERVRAGKMIPVDLFAAVAEVLAFVYRLRQRGIRG